jgi:hypothetical protein
MFLLTFVILRKTKYILIVYTMQAVCIDLTRNVMYT